MRVTASIVSPPAPELGVWFWMAYSDGTYRLESAPFERITAAHYASLPAYMKQLPKTRWEFNGWKVRYAHEMIARVLGGRWAEKWALRLVKAGMPLADAMRAAAAAAPSSSPAAFPFLAQQLAQQGRTQEAQAIARGVRVAPSGQLAPVGLQPAQAAPTPAQPAGLVAALLPLALLLLRGGL